MMGQVRDIFRWMFMCSNYLRNVLDDLKGNMFVRTEVE
jgi:hypothetical protein